MPVENVLTARWNLPTLRTYLNRLDRVPTRWSGASRRAWDRHAYRHRNLVVELLDDDRHVTARQVAVGRNLSPGGVAFLADRFIYPGTSCRVYLRGPHRHQRVVAGSISRCVYVVGSGALYDAGVKFDTLVDLPVFLPRTRRVHILLADGDPALPDLLAGLLATLNTQIATCPTDPQAIVQTTLADNFDLVLIDLEDRRLNAFDVTAELRSLGYVGPVIGLGVQIDGRLHVRCRQAGCTGYLRKPITRGTLRKLVRDLVARPLVSTLAHDVHVAPLIDEFVRGLPARLRALVRSFEQQKAAQLNELARRLRGEAGSYGFARLTEAATTLQTALAAGDSHAQVRAALDQLVHLGLTARPVHSAGFDC